ncbi:hypothetical protein ABZW10_36625 [Kitasatospora sp. NPDC004723]
MLRAARCACVVRDNLLRAGDNMRDNALTGAARVRDNPAVGRSVRDSGPV